MTHGTSAVDVGRGSVPSGSDRDRCQAQVAHRYVRHRSAGAGSRSRSIAGRSASDYVNREVVPTVRPATTPHPLHLAPRAPEPVGQRERALAQASRQEQR
jgi:hypothetical protein